MPAPVIKVYANVNASDTNPNWVELSTLALYWAGSLTTSSVYQPVSRRIYNQWCPALWIADTLTYQNGIQVQSYVPPTSATQYAKVFKIELVSGTLSDKIELTAFDDSSHQTVSKPIFGTPATGNTSWIKAIPTGGSFDVDSPVVPPQNWCSYTTSNPIADDTANALKGDIAYIRWSSIPTAGQCLYFALAHVIPYDAPPGWQNCVIVVRFRWIE